MVAYMDLNEQVDKEFGRARRRARLRRWLARLRNEKSRDLPSFEDARKALGAYNRVHRGMQVVDLDTIVGSVGRRRDFDPSFMPSRSGVGDRWKRVDLAFHKARDLPPVRLYKLGGAYYVVDGNHRVSVARFHSLDTIEALVTEFYPTKSAKGLVLPELRIAGSEQHPSGGLPMRGAKAA